MQYVYVLQNEDKKLYVGRTADLKRRLPEHLHGKVWTTRRMKNPKLIFYEAFISRSDAIRREKYLKTNKGKKGLKLIIRDSLK